MKKVLSVILTAVMLFSVVAVAFTASADFEIPVIYIIEFYNEDNVLISTERYPEGFEFGAAAKRLEPDSYKDEDGVTHYFKGWRSSVTGEVRTSSKLPSARYNVEYYAVYETQDNSGNQTFLQFIQSIFHRINMVFEYIWTIFFSE